MPITISLSQELAIGVILVGCCPGAVFSVWHNISGAIIARFFSSFKVSFKEAEYRYFRADTIDHWKFIE